jgi:hypothetical protein
VMSLIEVAHRKSIVAVEQPPHLRILQLCAVSSLSNFYILLVEGNLLVVA